MESPRAVASRASFALLFAFACVVAVIVIALRSSDPLLDAKAALADRDHARAERLLREISTPDARLLLGRALLERGRLDAAQEIFAARLKEAPGDVDALRGLGAVYAGRRQHELAVLHYQRAADARPDDALLWRELALAQRAAGDALGALSSIQRSLAIDKEQSDLTSLMTELALSNTPKGPELGLPGAPDPFKPRPIDPENLVPRPKLPPGPPQPPLPGQTNFR